MTQPVSNGHIEYLADGLTNAFAYDFKIETADEIEVRVNDAPQTYGVDFTLTGLGEDAGGYVVFTPVSPTVPDVVTLRLGQPFEQLLHLVPNAGLSAVALEGQLDNIVKQIQLLREELSRRPALAVGTPATQREMVLPIEASKVLAFNSTATGFELLDPTTATALVTDPSLIDDFSGSLSQFQSTADPGELSTESLSTSLAGEIQRLRFSALETKQAIDPHVTKWYETPRNTVVFNVASYGVFEDGNGVTNRTGILAAIAAAGTAHGIIYFPRHGSGIYPVSGVSSVSLSIPVGTADFQPQTQSINYHFYMASLSGIRFIGDGVTIQSDYTSGGCMFIFDGCRDVVWDGITLKSVTALNAAGTATVVGMNALALTSSAGTQDSERICIRNYRAENTYTGVYVLGTPAGHRLRGLSIINALIIDNYYGLNFHDNGDNVSFDNVRVVGGNRAYFAFGCLSHNGQMIVTGGTAGFNPILIKAYDINTEDITLKVRVSRTTSSTKLDIQSQHNVAAQPTPAIVRNINIDYNELGFSGGGGINFAYYQDAVVQATSNAKVFDNITLRGVFENDITTQTVFSTTGKVKLNIDDVVYVAGGPTILNAKGFYTYPYQTYTPALLIDGSSTGITYTTRVGEFYELGNMVYGTLRIVLSSKGAVTGGVTFTLPRTVRADHVNPPVAQVYPVAGFVGLTGAPIAFCNTGAAYGTLGQTGATGAALFDHTNLSDTTHLLVTFAYSK